MSGRYLTLGQIAAPHGVGGALKVNAYTDPPENLLGYKLWRLLQADGSSREVALLRGQRLGRQLRVELEGIADRDAAQALAGAQVQVPREALPPTAGNEHYREDLIGFTVVNGEGVTLGAIDHFLDLPGGAVMVVRGAREHVVPAAKPHLLSIDTASRCVRVDWPEEL